MFLYKKKPGENPLLVKEGDEADVILKKLNLEGGRFFYCENVKTSKNFIN